MTTPNDQPEIPNEPPEEPEKKGPSDPVELLRDHVRKTGDELTWDIADPVDTIEHVMREEERQEQDDTKATKEDGADEEN